MKTKLFVANLFTLALVNTGWADTTPVQGGFQPAAVPPPAASSTTPAPDAGSNQIIVDEGGTLHYRPAPQAGAAQAGTVPQQPQPGTMAPPAMQQGTQAGTPPQPGAMMPTATMPPQGQTGTATPSANAPTNAGQVPPPAGAAAPDTPGMSATQPTPAQ